ncbi:MAG: glycoside hydrolase family 25 protein [Oscillospiraceae bacterium]|nr:glycoside hydrolase family 25 protein [Oscillospiraceae bacterium]
MYPAEARIHNDFMDEIKNLPPLPDKDYKKREKVFDRDYKKILIIAETVCIAILAVTVILLKKTVKEDEEYISAQASRVYEYYDEGDAVILDDITYGDIWLSPLTDVPRHNLDFNNIVRENGYKHYDVDGVRQTVTGVDVSYHQGNIDWKAVKNDGVDFAMIRVGYRGYETGSLNIDPKFHEYAKGALDAGLEIGVYFYSQAVTVEEAMEEARMLLDEIEGYRVMYPVVFDWEIVGDESARTNKVTSQMLNQCAMAFCNSVAREGYIPMIYSVKRMALMKLDLRKLGGYDFWLAEYRDIPEYPYKFAIWQYASDGRVDGIAGDVDLNMSFVDYSKVRR